MPHPALASSLRIAAASLALTGAPAAQAFVLNVEDIPTSGAGNDSTTESVDFGDVDLDGDWDAVFADGGTSGNDQNRIWINQGGLQGGKIGSFADETGARLPVLADSSRDLELADIDGDDDLDLYSANTSFITNQGNRWWVNQGGSSGGSLGFFADETAVRWVGLNGPGSSVPTSLLLPNAAAPETFIDWSCDCDFGDLDSDGDLDLVHTTYGNVFSGDVPTRLYLNDGAGFFEEFNPSGFKLTFTSLAEGDPGLWCEGTQEADTTSSDGTRCDIATTALDADVADVDGDFDLDLVHGARNEPPRLFQNRTEENGGVLGFRDVTGASFEAGYASGIGHYEQELGDLDEDGDLDLYGCNWQAQFELEDVVLVNDGRGFFSIAETLETSESLDLEGDFLDYDGDGDLDLFVVGVLDGNRLYRNDRGPQGGALTFTDVSGLLPVVPNTLALDADAADVDRDGDYDVFEANSSLVANRYWQNVTDAPDQTAPRITAVEAVAGHAATAAYDVVRAQVFDNAPYYDTYFNLTQLRARVDGVDLPPIRMRASGGQVFRGELPGNLVGFVDYVVSSFDATLNATFSELVEFTNTGPTGTVAGGSSPGSAGTPRLTSLTSPFVGMPLHLLADQIAPGTPVLFVFSLTTSPGLDLGDGIVLNVGFPLLANPEIDTTDFAGRALLSLGKISSAAAGLTIHVQAFALDGAAGATWASSQRLELSFP